MEDTDIETDSDHVTTNRSISNMAGPCHILLAISSNAKKLHSQLRRAIKLRIGGCKWSTDGSHEIDRDDRGVAKHY